MNDRKQVTEYSSVLRGMWDTQNIEDLIHKLKYLRSQGYSKVELNKEYEPYCDDATIVLRAIKYRKENDKEYAARIEKENQQKEARRIEYERLKKNLKIPNSSISKMIPDQRTQIAFLLSVLFALILMGLVSLWIHKTFHIPFENQDSGNVIIFLPI